LPTPRERINILNGIIENPAPFTDEGDNEYNKTAGIAFSISFGYDKISI
jgi:hypothetical protein